MRRALVVVFLAGLVVLATGQNGRNFNVKLKALNQQRDGALLRCRGNVEMATESFVLRADEVDYHSDSGVADARGNVRIQLLPATRNSASVGTLRHP